MPAPPWPTDNRVDIEISGPGYHCKPTVRRLHRQRDGGYARSTVLPGDIVWALHADRMGEYTVKVTVSMDGDADRQRCAHR